MASKVILIRPSGLTKGFNTIQTAINNAVSGEMITIYNGVYTEQITIKNGVNMFCVPGVTITSNNSNGTIIDNGILARIILAGEPMILNTGGGRRINLTNPGSDVDESNEFSDVHISGSLYVTGSNITLKSNIINLSGSTYLTGTIDIQQNVTASSNLLVRGDATVLGILYTDSHSIWVTNDITGSTKFGQFLLDTHQRTGSMLITGSMTLDGPFTLSGQMFGTASYSTTASYATAATYATTASYVGRSQYTTVIAAYNSPEYIKFGADYVCDGVSDEIEINQAISESYYYHGDGYTKKTTIYFAEGDFFFSGSINIDKQCTITSAGKNRTSLVKDSNYAGDLFILDSANNDNYIFEMTDCKVYAFPYTASCVGSGIVVKNQYEVRFRDCEINGFFGGAGIKFENSTSHPLIWNDINNCWLYLNGVNILFATTGSYDIADVLITNCHFAGTNEAPFAYGGDPPSIVITSGSKVKDITINNNHFRRGGILIEDGNVYTIENNTFSEKFGEYGIKFADRASYTKLNSIVAGNNFHDGTGSFIGGTYNDLIYIGQNCDNIDVIGNRLYGETISKIHIASGSNLNGSILSNMPNNVKILRTNGNTIEAYSIESAISMSNAGDLIVVKPGTYNENITLKQGVNLHFEKGSILQSTTSGIATITDNNIAISCSITGYGEFKNLILDSNYNCVVYLTNENTKLEMEAYSLEGEGLQPANSIYSPTVYLSACKYFSLKADSVYNARNCGIYLSPGVETASLNIKNLITGNNEPGSGSTAIVNYSNTLYLNIDNIEINNVGHALSHRAGTCYANIRNIKTIANDLVYGPSYAISQWQGTGTQILYFNFDNIEAVAGIGIRGSGGGIEIVQGSSYINGKRIYTHGTQTNTSSLSALAYVGSGHIEHHAKIFQLITSGAQCVSLDNMDGKVVLESNLIKSCTAMAIWSTNSHGGTEKCTIRGARLEAGPISHVIQAGDTVNGDIYILENCILKGNNTSIYANTACKVRAIGEVLMNVPIADSVTILSGKFTLDSSLI